MDKNIFATVSQFDNDSWLSVNGRKICYCKFCTCRSTIYHKEITQIDNNFWFNTGLNISDRENMNRHCPLGITGLSSHSGTDASFRSYRWFKGDNSLTPQIPRSYLTRVIWLIQKICAAHNWVCAGIWTRLSLLIPMCLFSKRSLNRILQSWHIDNLRVICFC